MAQPNLDFFTSRGLVLKAEVSEGEDPSGTPSANAFEVMDGKSSTEFDKNERKIDRPFFTGDRFYVSNKRAAIEGAFELVPPEAPGVAGSTGTAKCETLLLPCGMARELDNGITRLYPISRNIPTVHAYWWHSGTYIESSACRGNITGLAMEIGKGFMANFRLQGSYEERDDVSLPTTFDYSAFLAPTIAQDDNTRFVVNVFDKSGAPVGTSDLHLWAKSLSVDFGNQLTTKQYTEKKVTGVTDRKATFTARFARPAKTDFDVLGARDNEYTVHMYMRTYESDNRYSELYVQGQLDQVTDTDIEGDFGYEVTGSCIASSSGNDEFQIEFGEGTFTVYNLAPNGTNGVAYTHTYEAGGDYVSPIVWSISSGALPTGVTLNASTGVISGTPSSAATFTYTIKATDDDGAEATMAESVTIA